MGTGVKTRQIKKQKFNEKASDWHTKKGRMIKPFC